MPRRSKSTVNFHDKRFMQISESHCGPATITMLLSNLGIEVTQEQVAEAGGVTSLIEMNGMRIDQMARAVRLLAPEAVFYYKDHATIAELVRIVQDYRHPVGVEWQGVFEESGDSLSVRGNVPNRDETQEGSPATSATVGQAGNEGLLPDSESEDNDYGHYSLVIRADRRRQQLMIADPYKDFFPQARIFSFKEFEGRWYDFNEVPDPVTGQPMLVEDNHMMFMITRRTVLFPRRMGMRTTA